MRNFVALVSLGLLFLASVVNASDPRLVGPTKRVPGSFLRIEVGDTRESVEFGLDGLIEMLRTAGPQTPVFLTKKERKGPNPLAQGTKKPVGGWQYHM